MADVNDGNLSFSDGQDDGTSPDQISSKAYRRGINLTTRNGMLGPRPGFSLVEIEVITPGGVDKLSYKDIFKSGKFQGACSYDAEDGAFLLTVRSGILFRIDPRTREAEVIHVGEESDGDRMDQYRRRIPWSHAGRFSVFFDFPALPVIVENRGARRVDQDRESFPGVPLAEIPTSVLGAFVQTRLFVANAGNEFTAGDPTGPRIFPDAPITFEEVFGIAAAYAAQAFSLGNQSARQPITYMGFLQVPDTATGVGPLIVATKNSVYAFRADEPRSSWENIAFGRLLLFNAGIAGPRAGVNTNSDFLFHSGDNRIRSLFMGRKEQERWSNAPISREIGPWLEEFERKDLLDIAFAGYHNNRIFFSVAPYAVDALNTKGQKVFDYAHAGMVVLELDNVSALGKGATPAWAGLWTGISPMEMVTLEEGAYFFSKDDRYVNRLYFLDEDATYDTFEGEQKDVISRVYSRRYNFQNQFLDKELGQVDYTLSNVEGDLNFKVEYRTSSSKRFSLWRDWKHKAVTENCEGPECDEEMPIMASHNFRELDFGDPQEIDCDEISEDQTRILRQIELRLTIQARNWNLEAIRLKFPVIPESRSPLVKDCDKITEKTVIDECEELDWELYRTAPRDPEWL